MNIRISHKNSLKIICLSFFIFFSCKKKDTVQPTPEQFSFSSIQVNGKSGSDVYYDAGTKPVIKISFSAAVSESSAAGNILIEDIASNSIPVIYSFSNDDSTVNITPQNPLTNLTRYNFHVLSVLQSKKNTNLSANIKIPFITSIDSTDKFPQITDSALLTLVQQQTFKYFWNFGHPVSGLARERTTSGDLVTTGGSGFGVMCILVGIERNFVTRTEGLDRISTIVNFLTTKASRYHGAFPHWLNGSTGATIPFSTQDDGADLVETSYMMQGLLCARQYFNSTTDVNEINIRAAINNLWNAVEWNWFRQNGQNVLYWHWSPDNNWAINQQISGWDEALIVYALAASSPVDSNAIPKIVYDNGWALNGGIKNGNTYLGIKLPLGPAYGGPLFFAHYSFLGINPNNLVDAYANYWTQDTAHARINYLYCVANPHHFNGYSSACWGLTASDDDAIPNGYDAHAPDRDNGVITPTAAISSLPYTPVESMNAMRFFYYTLGDKIWKQYGFVDAFDLSKIWFDSDFLAIDQGPEIVMIENYRSGLLWNLFMSCPEVKQGMTNLGFTSPNL